MLYIERMAKITAPLEALIAAAGPDEEVVVVLEMASRKSPLGFAAQTRQQLIAEKRSRFEQQVSPIERAIEEAGGEVLDRAWINSTMRVRVPAHAIRALIDAGDVEKADVEHRLQRD